MIAKLSFGNNLIDEDNLVAYENIFTSLTRYNFGVAEQLITDFKKELICPEAENV